MTACYAESLQRLVMRQIAIVLGMVFAFVACDRARIEGSFTQEELDWLVYDEGEEIVFINKEDSTDVLTYTVIDKTDTGSIEKFLPIEAEVTIKNDSTDQEFRIYLMKDQKAFKRYIKVGEVYRSLDLVPLQDQVLIGNATYDQVYILTETDQSLGQVAELYFNKAFGVLKYVTADNVHYIKSQPIPLNFETGTIN